MKPVSPVIPNHGREEVKIAEHQPEYQTLPAIYIDNGNTIITRWELDEIEKKQVQENGYLFVYLNTFGQPITPLLLSTELVNFPKTPQHATKMLNPLHYQIKVDFQNHCAADVCQKMKVHVSQISFNWEGYLCNVFVDGDFVAKFDLTDIMSEASTVHMVINGTDYKR